MVQLAEISWSEAQKIFSKHDVALIPVGATEQHGPHNPLGTDHLLAAALSKRLGDETGLPVTPIIPVGVSRHHRQFPGTLWVPPDVFREYLIHVALSIAEHGITKIVYVNGHGGNNASIMEVCEYLRRDYDLFACMVTSYPPGKVSGHAGAEETSQNLYYHPHLVHMERAVDTVQKTKLGDLSLSGMSKVGPASFPWDTIDITETGVLGTPGEKVVSTTATVEMGKELMEPYTEELIGFLRELMDADVSVLLPKPSKMVSS
jgi:creatinine amidohydrolase